MGKGNHLVSFVLGIAAGFLSAAILFFFFNKSAASMSAEILEGNSEALDYAENLRQFIKATSGVGKIINRNEVERLVAIRDQLEKERLDLFRKDPRRAIAALEGLPEPHRTKMLEKLLRDWRAEKGKVPNLKLRHFSRDFLNSLAGDVKGSLWVWIQHSDPDGIIAVLRGENSAFGSEEILPYLYGPYKYDPRLSREIVKAVLENDRKLEGPDSANLAHLLPRALNSLSDEELTKFASSALAHKVEGHSPSVAVAKALGQRMAGRVPEVAVSLIESLPEDSIVRPIFIEELSAQGANLSGVATEGDEVPLSRGAMRHAFGERDAEAIANAIDRTAGLSESRKLLEREISLAWRRPGPLEPILEGILNSESDEKNYLAEEFVGQWAERDIQGASEAMANQISQGSASDGMLRAFIEQIHGDDEAALLWISRIADPEQRRMMMNKAFADLQKTNPMKAPYFEHLLEDSR